MKNGWGEGVPKRAAPRTPSRFFKFGFEIPDVGSPKRPPRILEFHTTFSRDFTRNRRFLVNSTRNHTFPARSLPKTSIWHCYSLLKSMPRARAPEKRPNHLKVPIRIKFHQNLIIIYPFQNESDNTFRKIFNKFGQFQLKFKISISYSIYANRIITWNLN